MRILLVEDDELFGDCVLCGLGQYHYNVMWVKNGVAAWRSLQDEYFDMVLLDLGLPGISGEEVLKNMRLSNITVPVIILSGRCKKSHCVKGFDLGADDFLSKPFDFEELCARIRAVQRRTTARVESTSTITVGNIVLDTAAIRVFKFGKEVKLFCREFVLLKMLMESAGCVISRRRILQHLYGWSTSIDSNVLEVHIHNLRKKLGYDVIETCCKEGYVFAKKTDSGERRIHV